MTIEQLRETLKAWAAWRRSVAYPGCALAVFGQTRGRGFASRPPIRGEIPRDVRALMEAIEELQVQHGRELEAVTAWYLRGMKTAQDLAVERNIPLGGYLDRRRIGETILAGWMTGRGL